jgi:nitrous oxidase accessory protein NosD
VKKPGRLVVASLCGVVTVAVLGAGALAPAAGADPAAWTVCPQGCAFTSINAAIAAAAPGETITIGPGTYAENVAINKAVALAGSGPATVVEPAIANPDGPNCAVYGGAFCGGDSQAADASIIMLVQSSDVTIKDMTLEGANPALSGGVTVNGVSVDARDGIVDDDYYYGPSGPSAGCQEPNAFQDLTVTGVTVRDVFERGIESTGNCGYTNYYGATFTFDGDTVVNVDGDGGSISMFNFGGAGVFRDNTVRQASDSISSNWSQGTTYTGNVISDAGSGIHTDNNGGAGGAADTITGNTVRSCVTDGYGVWVFAPYVPATIADNRVQGCYVGLAVFGSQAPGEGPTFSDNVVKGNGAETTDPAGTYGAYVTTDLLGYGAADVNVTFTGNSFEKFTTGLFVTQTSQSSVPAPQATVVAHENIFDNNGTGVNAGSGTSVDASENWWGCAHGPGSPGCDTAVGTLVDTPFLTSHP